MGAEVVRLRAFLQPGQEGADLNILLKDLDTSCRSNTILIYHFYVDQFISIYIFVIYLLQRHQTVLQEDQTQDARDRRTRGARRSGLWRTGMCLVQRHQTFLRSCA